MASEKSQKTTTFATTELQEAGVYSLYDVKLICIPDYKGYLNCKADCEVKHGIDPCLLKLGQKMRSNHFVNFNSATFALLTHVCTSMHKGCLHQQVCCMTWKCILSKILFREKKFNE